MTITTLLAVIAASLAVAVLLGVTPIHVLLAVAVVLLAVAVAT